MRLILYTSINPDTYCFGFRRKSTTHKTSFLVGFIYYFVYGAVEANVWEKINFILISSKACPHQSPRSSPHNIGQLNTVHRRRPARWNNTRRFSIACLILTGDDDQSGLPPPVPIPISIAVGPWPMFLFYPVNSTQTSDTLNEPT